VITAPDGEAFGEDGAWGGMDAPIARQIPLVFRGPGVPRRSYRDRVGLVDVAPTIVELLGLERPERFEGRSLVRLFEDEPLGELRRAPHRYPSVDSLSRELCLQLEALGYPPDPSLDCASFPTEAELTADRDGNPCEME